MTSKHIGSALDNSIKSLLLLWTKIMMIEIFTCMLAENISQFDALFLIFHGLGLYTFIASRGEMMLEG